jgi:LPS export ABC transporter protein LptC
MRNFLIIIIPLVFFGCQSERVQPSIMSNIQLEKIPAQESWNSKVTFSDSGKTKAVLYTGHIRVYYDTQETLLDTGVKVDFYDDNQVKSSTLTSKKGRVDDVTQNLWARDSVVVVNDSGVTITTSELMWRNKDRKIVSDKFVTIVSPKENIQGYGFESDQSLRNYVIYNPTYTSRRDTL